MDSRGQLAPLHEWKAMGMLPILLLELRRLLSPSRAIQEPSSRSAYGFVVEVLQEVAAALTALSIVIIALIFVYLYCFPALLFSVTQNTY